MRPGWASRRVTRLRRPAGVILFCLVALSTPCRAAEGSAGQLLDLLSSETFMILAIGAAAGTLLWAFIAVRKLVRDELRARQRARDLEIELNETEAALAAEPHVLIVWRGRHSEPDRIVGDMRGTVRVPADSRELMRFSDWLEPESASALFEALATMRDQGTAFNIGIRTQPGELLEADGRVSGGLATLRLRPLAGEDRKSTRLNS